MRSEEKDFIEHNRVRVAMISAAAKAYQQLSPSDLKQTLPQMMFDSRHSPTLKALEDAIPKRKSPQRASLSPDLKAHYSGYQHAREHLGDLPPQPSTAY